MKEFSAAKSLCFVFLIFSLQQCACGSCLDKERADLLELKAYLNTSIGAESVGENFLSSWSDDRNSDCCNWERIKCSKSTGHVIQLSLGNLVSQSMLSDMTLNLSVFHSFEELQSLDFSYNLFSGLFDHIKGFRSFERMKNLRVLDFSYNEFNNSILPFIGAASSLRTINLEGNQIKGVFPPKELANMKNLKVLNLNENEVGFLSNRDLENFKNLEVLQLSGNYINDSDAGQGFSHMTNLQALDLSYNYFSEFSQKQGICGLAYLRELDLSGNSLIGLPHCLANLTHLRTLDLSHNQLRGSMPTFLSNLPSLEYLSLLGNNFEGSFWLSSLTNQSSLKILRVSSNLGTFHIQTESSWIPNFQLKMLQLQNCNLDGLIPAFLLHQHDLRVIDLSHNKLVGVFPSWLLQNNTKLKSVLLRNNSLAKFQLPTLIHGLYNLDISSNSIDGYLHESIGNVFPNLKTLNISNNGFQGVIPSSMGQMKTLWLLDTSSNSLSGQLPRDFLSGCRGLKFLILSKNGFQGQIFPEYSDLVVLSFLFLDSNNFTDIGIGLLKSRVSLQYLDISNNRLSGKIPSWTAGFSELIYLRMRRNHLEGPFPHWLQNLTSLYLLDISHNTLSGPIPNNLNSYSFKDLQLQNNNFVGSIPDALFESTELQLLDLRNNKLSGEIPKSIGKSLRLNVLLLQKNHLHGYIPKQICNLRNINFLDLSYNSFNGSIPSCLNNMSFGNRTLEKGSMMTTSLDFVYVGLLSFEVANFYTSDLFLDEESDENSYYVQPLVTVDFLEKNRYETFQDKVVRYMFGLDLSSNGLSGPIPIQVGNLENILSLNLSHNRLTGGIPESISNLKNIESLDLSHNMLNASIPSQLAELNNLGYFDVSYNNLSGPVPFFGHLTTFDERSYIGNANLCGKPTDRSCGSTEVTSSSTRQFDEDDDGALIDIHWFYWSASATFVTVLLGLFVFLCIDSRWSREWFYRVDLCVYHLQRLKYVSIFK